MAGGMAGGMAAGGVHVTVAPDCLLPLVTKIVERFGTLPGIILGISAAVAAVAFHYAYVSVWRFFAALLSAYCVVILRQLPGRETPIE